MECSIFIKLKELFFHSTKTCVWFFLKMIPRWTDGAHVTWLSHWHCWCFVDWLMPIVSKRKEEEKPRVILLAENYQKWEHCSKSKSYVSFEKCRFRNLFSCFPLLLLSFWPPQRKTCCFNIFVMYKYGKKLLSSTNSLNFRIKQLILLYTEQGATLLASQAIACKKKF